MKLDSKVFRDAANIYLWDGIEYRDGNKYEYSCHAISSSASTLSMATEYIEFYTKHFKPILSGTCWWKVGWRFKTQAAVQRHRKKMLLKAADLVDKMNAEEK